MIYKSNHPLVAARLAALRDKKTGPKAFREIARGLATFLIYEATRDLVRSRVAVETPMGTAQCWDVKGCVAFAPILRAGLGMIAGALLVEPRAQIWHLGLYRDHDTLKPKVYYTQRPSDIGVEFCLILDPMIATGGSAVAAVNILKEWGVRRIKFVGFVGASAGIDLLSRTHPDEDIHLAAIDSELDERGYIIPGLGDAGDRLWD